jgi:uncharacterized membrane protein YphA (DoxX/SURF4 family)
MKIITQIARVLVGLLFIFSGFIKANDPIGFSYKLDEYFSVFGEHIWSGLAWFENISVFLAIFITGLEILQGLLLLSGSKIKWNSWALLALIVFFTFLTFYSAYTGYIKECGCFGDVIPLKAWQSFYKDLILLVLILIILIGKKHIHPLIKKPKPDAILVLILTLISFSIPVYAYNYLPIIDFGEFAPGKSVITQRKFYFSDLKEKEKNAKFVYKNLATGQNEEYPLEVIMKKMELYDETKYKFVDKYVPGLDTTKLLPLSVAIDFRDQADGDHTEEFLTMQGYHFVLISTHLELIKDKQMNKVRDFAQLAETNKVSFVGLTSSEWSAIDMFRHDNQLAFDFYRCIDDTPLKGAIRSNPGLILFKDSVIVKKWHYNAFPSFNDVKEQYMK